MNPLYISAIAVAVVLLVVLIIAAIFWLRRPASVPPATPPVAMPAAVPAPPHANHLPEDEWEAHTPYPEYARAAPSPAAPPYRRTPDSRHAGENYFPHYDAFEFDDVEPIESHDAPPPRQAGPTAARDVEFSMFHPSSAIVSSPPAASNASTRCPRCNSAHIDTLNVARMAGSTIGSVAGATGGFAMAISGAEAGAAVGAIGGPIGALFGGLTGAVLAGLLGSAAGNAAGSAVGAAIDENMLDNYRCLSCGHTFGAQHG